jgi:hypothetical protein
MLTVKLQAGGELMLGCTADPVDLTREEATQVQSLVGAIRALQGVVEQTRVVRLGGERAMMRLTLTDWMQGDERGRALIAAITDLVDEYQRPLPALAPEASCVLAMLADGEAALTPEAR